jgi:hypothetical protein
MNSKKKILILRNVKGVTLIEALVSLTLIFIALWISISAVQSTRSNGDYAKTALSINMVRSNFLNILSSPQAWQNTLNGNPSIGLCESAGGSYCDGGALVLYNEEGQVFYNQSLTSGDKDGFNMNGVVCNSYDSANGSFSCPVRVLMQWTPLCSVDLPKKCQTQIDVSFQLKMPGSSASINTERWKLTVLK